MTYADASQGPYIVHPTLVEIMLDPPVRLFNGVGRLRWGEFEFLGAGDLGEISEITGGSDLDAADVRMTLSGIDVEFRGQILNEIARGAEVYIFSGFVDEATGEWSLEPDLDYAGFISEAPLTEAMDEAGAVSISIEVTCLSAAAWARRLTLARRSDAHQRKLYAGDEFFAYTGDQRAVPTIAGPSGGNTPAINPPAYNLGTIHGVNQVAL